MKMKLTRKLLALVLAAMLVLAMSVTAFAQDVTYTGTDAGSATITIQNAAKGETYSVYKLFDATVTGSTDGGSIAYTGTIPDSLKDCFAADGAGNISVKSGVDNNTLITALKTWATSATATATEESDGSVLNFNNLPYGYYVVTSSQGNGTNITVTSTNPNATIYDKNTTTPGGNPTEGGKVKEADKTNVNIGDTVTYTVTFTTANFSGSGATAKRIVSYTITDTLPDFLSNVTVTSIEIGGNEYKVNGAFPQFDTTKSITIPWVGNDGASLYANGAVVVITYTATVADNVTIAGSGNKNEVTISWTDEEDNTPSDNDKITGSDTISTYAIALKKVDEKGTPLSGATFQFPFYVKENADTDGAYIYAGTNTGDGLTNTITTPATGEIVVKGVMAGTYSITETAAPQGYNKLTAPVSVTAVELTTTTTNTTFYLDADGNVVEQSSDDTVTVTYTNNNLAASAILVVNKAGSTLPTTGGVGTTIFYIVGAVLVIGAGVLLVTKKRMSVEG